VVDPLRFEGGNGRYKFALSTGPKTLTNDLDKEIDYHEEQG
jgi:hypothetical protein